MHPPSHVGPLSRVRERPGGEGRPAWRAALSASLLAHSVVLVLFSWHASTPTPTQHRAFSPRTVVVWVSPAPQPNPVAEPTLPSRTTVAKTSAAERSPRHRAIQAVSPIPASAPERVSGAVFALPTIAFGGGAGSPMRWMRVANGPAAPAPLPQMTDHDAAAAQVALALQQQRRDACRVPGEEDAACAEEETGVK